LYFTIYGDNSNKSYHEQTISLESGNCDHAVFSQRIYVFACARHIQNAYTSNTKIQFPYRFGLRIHIQLQGRPEFLSTRDTYERPHSPSNATSTFPRERERPFFWFFGF
jgi:hypothetical protein